MGAEISERKKKILQIVVDEYIETATPVSSKAITQKHLTEVSSATVRSELAALEDQGYLIQFHTSGGRIPSPKAYRLYIDELMERSELSSAETEFIRSSFERRAASAESIVRSVADVISELTDYTSVALSGQSEETIGNIGLFPCGDSRALLLIVTDLRIFKDSFIALPEGMRDEEVEKMSRTLQNIFVGKRMDRAREAEEEAMQALAAYRQICREVLDAIFAYTDRREVVLSGGSKSLLHPEYDDVGKIRTFLSLVEDEEEIGKLLSDGTSVKIGVKIGSDGGVPEDCSIVTASYSVDGRQIGTYGVLGPVRMDYAKVVSVLESVGDVLEKVIKNSNGGK